MNHAHDTTALAPVEAAAPREDGRIGLVVLTSVLGGLLAGALLDLVAFAGGAEPVITGIALLSFAFGLGLLAALSSRMTAQPQPWATRAAVWVGLAGAAVALLRPDSHVLDLVGWVWPVLFLALVASMARAVRRSLRSRSKPAVLYPAFVALALLAIGGAYETVADATASPRVPASGRLYAVNGHSLFLSCFGSGTPTVVLFNGLGERASSWERVQPDVARTTRVCSFDRAGEGWSGPAAGPQDGNELAADTHALLAAARIPGPYVLAGHSVGGAYALVYAHQYPREVAGVTLVDSAMPWQFELPAYPSFYSNWRRVSALFPTIARTGITRALGLGTPRQIRADHDEFLELPTVFEQARLTRLGSKPLVVLTAGRGQQAGWSSAQDRLVRLSTRHAHRTFPGATHAAMLEDRRFARSTSSGIEAVVAAARKGSNLVHLTKAPSRPFQLQLPLPRPFET